MSNKEHFCLRWNDFESNISKSFKSIRDEKDFFDVTLACEDDQVQAHRLILSACSPFFREVLRKHSHQHPLLFLKGVKYVDIVAILNFMYHGEVNITQEDLNGFLAVAEELKVKGLTQQTNFPESSKSTENEKNCISSEKKACPMPMKNNRTENTLVKDDDIQEIGMIPVKSEPLNEFSSPGVMRQTSFSTESTPYDKNSTMIVEASEENYDQGYDYLDYEDDTCHYDQAPKHFQMCKPNENKESFSNSQDPEELIYFDRDPTPGSKKNWRCKLCGEYFHNRGNAMNHVEAKHLTVNYNCDFCTKRFKSRNSLKTHISTYHGSSGNDAEIKREMVSPSVYNPGLVGSQNNSYNDTYYSEHHQ